MVIERLSLVGYSGAGHPTPSPSVVASASRPFAPRFPPCWAAGRYRDGIRRRSFIVLLAPRSARLRFATPRLAPRSLGCSSLRHRLGAAKRRALPGLRSVARASPPSARPPVALPAFATGRLSAPGGFVPAGHTHAFCCVRCSASLRILTCKSPFGHMSCALTTLPAVQERGKK